MTRFVTGGAGFIGANYLFYLREHYPDDRLVCIDKLTYAGNLSTLAPLLGQPNFRFAKRSCLPVFLRDVHSSRWLG